MTSDLPAKAPGAIPPASDEGPTVAAVAPQENKQNEISDFQCDGIALQAALRVEGEDYALAYIARMHEGTSYPDELALVVSFLTGEMLNGACRLIEKTLRSVHHG